MATELEPNRCEAVALDTVLSELKVRSTWLVVWSAEDEDVFLVTHGVAEGDAVPAACRTIPAGQMPFPLDVSPYGGRLFVAASGSCTVVFEARE